MDILGISAFYHDSAAALLRDGVLVAAAQEERFTRRKHDASFPANAVAYCLTEGGIGVGDLDAIVFYDKPLLKFERLLETYLATAPRGFDSFRLAMPIWLREKLQLKALLRRELAKLGGGSRRASLPLLFTEHHQAHAASAFYPSPFARAAVLCLDGVGEWATTSLWLGDGPKLEPVWQIDFPHSLGLLYSAFTYYTGFRVNSGEYKLMGLAPYGEPRWVDAIRSRLIDVKADGTFRLDLDYFDFASGLRMTSERFHELFGGPPREPEGLLTQKEMDLARSIQVVLEEIMLRLARTAIRELETDSLCLAGGVALNCVANARIRRETDVQNLWIQPAAGDAGGAVGAAFAAWHLRGGGARLAPAGDQDAMSGGFLGPRFSLSETEEALESEGAVYTRLSKDDLLETTAALLDSGKVVGWFQGRMEFGPRALGSRSILGDPRNPRMQSQMNLKIKFRESFRPFAPAVLAEDVEQWFEHEGPSPYMLLTAPVREDLRTEINDSEKELFGIDKLNLRRSVIPAVTHVDYSARLQTVHESTNPRFHALLAAFRNRTGCGVLVNTSFNVRGEPIVCTPRDAFRCFMRTEMDALVIEDFLLEKREQTRRDGEAGSIHELDLD